MYQAPQGAFVHPETRRVIETLQTGPAGRAYAAFVQRPVIHERRMADRAEIFGIVRNGRSHTLVADGDASPFEKRAFADAAIVRKKQRKNSVRDPANEMEGGRSR
jgi:hypothetical protein